MKDIKFRAWDSTNQEMLDWNQVENSGEKLSSFGHGTLSSLNLMQFTGLLDKHGTEIYEGDIYARNENYKYEVIFNTEHARFVLLSSFRVNGKRRYRGITSQKGGEIIGNIYEHPALLRKEEE